jgi:hypothetical protein
MSKHTITTEIKVSFTFPGMAEGERETAYPVLSITYQYSPSRPAYTPRGEYGPIDPPDPAEIEFVSAKLVNGDGLDPSDQQIQEWASDWLDYKGYDVACDHAETARQPDPDFLYEQKRDEGF